MTFKTDIHDLCKRVVMDSPGWKFTSGGDFKNTVALGHTDLIVSPGFYFSGGGAIACTSVTPAACVYNKKTEKLRKLVFGKSGYWTRIIKYQIAYELTRRTNVVKHIFATKGEPWRHSFITGDEAEPYLREVLSDGIALIERYFDLSSEENLLRNLPTGYHRDDNWGPGVFYENLDGISHCLAACVLGDFDFVERYASPDFKTMGPKREVELGKILAALPELKRKFAETGSVI